ncbi:RecQ family ATP-dependent DNA helicase [Actinacidiphila oryziradicis]|uniref:ATP-dependent DNA helicase RecQ n=1 Tax=Actinacidiphila oryziradicis TaxID=2571141 RepID=A0A4U0RUS9_9ACTN|nr:RecQ family ATP-dependent DNA helicase [Actinacidiphila oryziradicis]TJZ99945.1 RecQ family ATP-dependent DNA helicase [Actinacidiphila oryziradicis]
MPISLFTARRLRKAAREVFGWDRLRPGQLTAMKAVMARRDAIVVMPTGSGKSAVYQVPSLLLPGPTIVVSPLIALQRDQVAGLLRRGGQSAVAVNSTMTRTQNEQAWQSMSCGDTQFLFLAPEQLAKQEVLERLAALKPSLFVVDEAQCVSSWGHDFRPDYLRLGQAAESVGRPPVLALTASAAAPVRADIIEQLGMRKVREVVAGFDRPNIRLEVTHFLDDAAKRRAVVERAAAEPKPGIVYAATRKDAEAYAAELGELGLDAAAYHAGTRPSDRATVHDRFLAGELDVVVATSAFGMGIDKPDVRFVLHASVPGSLDAYYQEIGRAGRDGAAARAILHYRKEDLGLQKFFSTGRPDLDTIVEVARRVRDHGTPVTPTELRQETGLSASRLTAVVNLLEKVEAVTTERGKVAPVPGAEPEEAGEQAMRLGTAHESLERSRVEMMRGLAETTGCRRRFLLGYFGERLPDPCGNCDRCEKSAGAGTGNVSGLPRPRTASPERSDHPFPPGTRVRHHQWGDGEVLSEEEQRITVLFASVGYRTLSLPVILDKTLLTAVPE